MKHTKKGRNTNAADGWFQIVSTVSRYEKFEEIRLNQSHERHRSSCHTWGIGKDINTESEGKAPEKSRPSGLVSAKMQHQDDVDQWCGTIEEMNMIEHQSLYQQEHYKQHKSSYLFYTH